MSADLTKIVGGFAGQRVLLVGDLILDRYIYGDAERISPEAPVPVIRVVERRDAVGGSANVAACLRALGVAVDCCGVIGKGENGLRLTTLLREGGISTEGLVISDTRPTTTKTRMVGLAQHRHRQQLLRVDEEDAGPLAEDDEATVLKFAMRLMERVDVVCIEDYDKGVVSDSLAAKIIARAKELELPVLVDPARLSSYGRYHGADVITPNRTELAITLGKTPKTLKKTAEAAQLLAVRDKFGHVVVTLDRDGALLVPREGKWRHVPTTPRSVYDNTGAGDAVLAMLAASVAAGANLPAAVRLANLVGGLEVERFGCVPITADEVLAEIRLEQRRGGKLRSSDDLIAELELRRDRGETIVFTNGCFDILHAGHADYLQKCREFGSVVVIGLNSDSSVRAQGKGEDRPICPFDQRAAVLSALECVDYVVGFDEQTPEKLIQRIRPDVLVKGKDWADKGVVGQDAVESNGGKVELVDLVEGVSTTALIERIRNSNS